MVESYPKRHYQLEQIIIIIKTIYYSNLHTHVLVLTPYVRNNSSSLLL